MDLKYQPPKITVDETVKISEPILSTGTFVFLASAITIIIIRSALDIYYAYNKNLLYTPNASTTDTTPVPNSTYIYTTSGITLVLTVIMLGLIVSMYMRT